MHPLVAVQKSQDIPSHTKENGFRDPGKAHYLSALAAGGKDHRLLEGPEWDWNLKHDAAVVEFAQSREMGIPSIAERLDHDLVVAPR